MSEPGEVHNRPLLPSTVDKSVKMPEPSNMTSEEMWDKYSGNIPKHHAEKSLIVRGKSQREHPLSAIRESSNPEAYNNEVEREANLLLELSGTDPGQQEKRQKIVSELGWGKETTGDAILMYRKRNEARYLMDRGEALTARDRREEANELLSSISKREGWTQEDVNAIVDRMVEIQKDRTSGRPGLNVRTSR